MDYLYINENFKNYIQHLDNKNYKKYKWGCYINIINNKNNEYLTSYLYRNNKTIYLDKNFCFIETHFQPTTNSIKLSIELTKKYLDYLKEDKNMSGTNLTSINYKTLIENSLRPVVIKFYADWCGPCKGLAPIYDEIVEQYKDKINFYQVNVDVENKLCMKFGIRSVPSIKYLKNGEVVDESLGMITKKELTDKVKNLLN